MRFTEFKRGYIRYLQDCIMQENIDAKHFGIFSNSTRANSGKFIAALSHAKTLPEFMQHMTRAGSNAQNDIFSKYSVLKIGVNLSSLRSSHKKLDLDDPITFEVARRSMSSACLYISLKDIIAPDRSSLNQLIYGP
jgi:hypothetical protein